MKKVNSTILVALFYTVFSILWFGMGLGQKLVEKYYNYRLSQVAQITVEEETLQGNSESNINNFGLVAETKDYIFYTKGYSQIYRAERDFKEEVGIIANPGDSRRDLINVAGDWMFFSNGAKIQRMKTDGSNAAAIFRGHALQMRLIGSWIYFINFTDDMRIYRMDVNGQTLEGISEKDVNDMAIYGSRIYYSVKEDDTDYLKTMSLDGSAKSVLSNILTSNMVVADQYIYYIDAYDKKLCRFKIEDKTVEQLSEERIGWFCKDDKWLFYTVRLPDELPTEYKGLYRMNLDGSKPMALDGETTVEHIFGITEDWVLYNSRDREWHTKLMRIRKDGRDKTIMGDDWH